MYPIGKPSKRKPYIGTPQSPIHYQLVRGGQVVKADAFIRPKKIFLFKSQKIAQKCND